MLRIEKSIKVNCAPEKAFAFATDFGKAAQWQTGVVEVKPVTEGPLRVGSMYIWVAKMLGQKMETKSEVTVWEPPTRYEYKGVASPFPLTGGYSFQAEGGGTLVTLFGEAEPGGFFKLAEGMLRGQMDKQLDDNLQALKKALEE